MGDVKPKIRERYGQMSRAERKLSDFILTSGQELLGMTAVDIAKNSGVSSASVIRYVKKLGFDGLDGFKLAFASEVGQDSDSQVLDLIINKDDSIDDLCDKMRLMVETAFQDFFYQIDKAELERAIKALRKARKIYTLGIGASMLPAYDLYHKLRRANFDAVFELDVNMVTEFFNYVDKRDVIVAFSYSGQSREVLYASQVAKRQGAALIAVTRKHPSPLEAMADIRLFVPDREHVMRIGAFTSKHTSLMMEDLLYLGVIQENLEKIEVELVKTRKLVEGLKIKN